MSQYWNDLAQCWIELSLDVGRVELRGLGSISNSDLHGRSGCFIKTDLPLFLLSSRKAKALNFRFQKLRFKFLRLRILRVEGSQILTKPAHVTNWNDHVRNAHRSWTHVSTRTSCLFSLSRFFVKTQTKEMLTRELVVAFQLHLLIMKLSYLRYQWVRLYGAFV